MRQPLELPPGLNADDTTFAASGRWSDGSNVRFWEGRPQTINGWESITGSTLTGTCRTIFPWNDTAGNPNIAFGTNSKLQLYYSSTLYDITPYGPPALLGSSPLASTNLSSTVVVTHTAHGYTTGTSVAISGATAFNGLTTGNLNITATITVLTADTYSYTAGAAATGTGSGGGSAVVVVPQTELPAGAADGTGGSGYGTGSYSVGYYSAPSTSDYFARTWALSAWGQNLIASPRQGAIYTWTNNTSNRATAITTAPLVNTYVLVAPTRQVFAFGCSQEADATFNPLCIRHSSVGNNTEWNSAANTTAREYVLPSGGRIVAARVMGSNLLIWTSAALWLGTYVGSVNQIWRFDKLGDQCGLIGPNAAVVVGQRAFWIGPDLQTYAYALGGAPGPIGCPILKDFRDYMASSQGDKVVASSNGTFSEIRFDYPDSRDGNECSRYLAAHVPTLAANPDLAWYRGQMARTAFCDAPSFPTPAYPLGVSPEGNIYYHDKGTNGDGAAFSWFIETAENYLSPDQNIQIRQVWPDFKDQVGPVMVQVSTRFAPQGDLTVVLGSNMAPGDRKSDVRATGRLARVKFYGSSNPTFVRVGSPTFDVTTAGGR